MYSMCWYTVAGAFLKEPLERRREILSEVFKSIEAAPIALSESLNASADELVRVAKEFGFEGIVAKRKDSFYESGKRTGAGSSTRSTEGKSLSSAATRRAIRLMR